MHEMINRFEKERRSVDGEFGVKDTEHDNGGTGRAVDDDDDDARHREEYKKWIGNINATRSAFLKLIGKMEKVAAQLQHDDSIPQYLKKGQRDIKGWLGDITPDELDKLSRLLGRQCGCIGNCVDTLVNGKLDRARSESLIRSLGNSRIEPIRERELRQARAARQSRCAVGSIAASGGGKNTIIKPLATVSKEYLEEYNRARQPTLEVSRRELRFKLWGIASLPEIVSS
jgi:hypothetical protein